MTQILSHVLISIWQNKHLQKDISLSVGALFTIVLSIHLVELPLCLIQNKSEFYLPYLSSLSLDIVYMWFFLVST